MVALRLDGHLLGNRDVIDVAGMDRKVDRAIVAFGRRSRTLGRADIGRIAGPAFGTFGQMKGCGVDQIGRIGKPAPLAVMLQ